MVDIDKFVMEMGRLVAERINGIIDRLHERKDNNSYMDWDVNWADLSCVSVAYCVKVYPTSIITEAQFIVTLSEASPDDLDFCKEIESIYFDEYSSHIRVVTEW
jgi:hypothetical protein